MSVNKIDKPAADLKVGDTVYSDTGNAAKITQIKAGNHTPFGKVAKFWHPKPLTIYFRYEGRIECFVVAPDDMIEVAA